MPVSDHRLALLGGTTDLGDVAVALRAILRRSQRVRGPDIAALEAEWADALGVRHATCFATGRLALTAILEGLGVGPADEVLVPVPTHVVVPNAVRAVGARPVFVDSEPRTLNIDLDHARRLVTGRTRVLLLQHTFGIPADLDDALQLARTHDLDLVEDCVHALGARWNGLAVGAAGRAGFFSTEETKMISTTLGGVATTDDDDLAGALAGVVARCEWPPDSLVQQRMAKLVMYHLLTWPPVHRAARALYEALGRRHPLPLPISPEESAGELPERYYERLGNAQAAVGRRQLRGLDANLEHRRRIAHIYHESIPPAARVQVPAAADPSWVRYPLLVRDRSQAMAALAPYTVAGTWFSSVLEESDRPAVAGYVPGSCPVAEILAQHLVNLPTHQRVTDEAAHRIADRAAELAVGWEEVAWLSS